MTDFELDAFDESNADVYVDVSDVGGVPWSLVRQLDEAGIRAIGDLADSNHDEGRVRRIMSGCCGVMTDRPHTMRLAEELSLPSYDPADSIVTDFRTRQVRPYAFFIGRLERDFAHAREAMRVAVQREAGVPLLWIDDGRHRTNVEGVRERTRLLLRHATFVIAYLTLGAESPDRENPSRAHEIGMAIAYDRSLMLLSQEPRRYPYFSIGDMQMTFWETEDELERSVAGWIYSERRGLSRRVFNHELATVGFTSKISPPTFDFDWAKRFIGPNLGVSPALRVLPR